MNHTYLNEIAVHAFAQQLFQSQDFRNHWLVLYADVPLKCLKYEAPYFLSDNNLAAMDQKTAVQTVDFLVCNGEEPVLAITFDLDVSASKDLFDSVLKGIPHFPVYAAAFLQEDAPALAQKVLDFLAPCFTDEHSKVPYKLPQRHYLSVMPSVSELQRKGLLDSHGRITPYGRDCGLFVQWDMDGSGGFTQNPEMSASVGQAFLDAMDRNSAFPGKDDAHALRTLLNTPITELFRKYEDEMSCLTIIMWSVPELKGYPAGMQPETYGDYLELIYRLTGTIGDDNPESKETADDCQEILSLLAVPLSDPQTSPILSMPLQLYFEEAAVLGQFHYPEWLYRSRFCPYLNGERFSSAKYTLAQVVQYALDAYYQGQAGTFPTLYELLVSPVCHLN